jgi:hypothetical protein
MLRTFLSRPYVTRAIIALQVIPLLAFPPSSYALASQELWLPAFLCVLSGISVLRLFLGKGRAAWAWYMISFAQGFNIISRLMMLMPHATYNDQGVQRFNSAYVLISVVAMVISAFEIWYHELPEVRARLSA